MSAPRAMGCCSTGVANVLSTTTRKPAARPMAAHAAISVTFSSGLDGVSSQSNRVSGRMASFTAARLPVSTNVKSTPNFAKSFTKIRHAPP